MEERGSESKKSNGETSMVGRIAAMQDYVRYRDLAWEGSFEEYLNIVRERPQATRNAFQRVYDMVISYGTEEYIDNKKKLVRYNFFRDEIDQGKDAVFGLDIPLMRLMNVLKAAAEGYGPEKRVILLHGPVGSAKSTIVRLLKRGLEEYSKKPEGALFSFGWARDLARPEDLVPCPMHEEPLHLATESLRPLLVDQLNAGRAAQDLRVVKQQPRLQGLHVHDPGAGGGSLSSPAKLLALVGDLCPVRFPRGQCAHRVDAARDRVALSTLDV